MTRRKITFRDWITGAIRSLRSGTAMNPFVTQKFVNQAHDERVARTMQLGQLAVKAATRDAVGKWLLKVNRTQREEQLTSDDAIVNVSSGWSREHREPVTDIVIDPRYGNTNEHLHIVINQHGDVIYEKWNENRW